METMLMHDDEHCRQAERLIAELSSELCTKDVDDVDAVVQTMLPRIAEVAAADTTTLIIDAAGDDERRIHRYTAAPADADLELTPATEAPTLWDRVPLDAEPLILERIPGDLPAGALTPDVLDHLRTVPLQSAVVIPVVMAGERICVLAFETVEHRAWPAGLVHRLRLFAEVLGSGLQRARQTRALRETRQQLERLAGREIEDPPFRTAGFARPATRNPDRFNEIVGESPTLRAALRQVQEVAATRSTVLLRGETGSGKELFARAIHARSPRRANSFVVVNCAALPPSLIESELFGHTRGAFTGAVTTRQGRFELAHRGTLFLDEIGDLPLDLQTKLLRVLQEGTFERLGSSQTQKVDVRIIAATHRDLRRMISDGSFREDLYYRLSVFPIRLPALRERREDIPKLVWHIINKHKDLTHHKIRQVPDSVMQQLQHRHWPGNVRELENVVEGALILSTGDVLTLLDESLEPDDVPAEDDTSLSAVERAHIQEVLRACGWRINGAGNAAERLGLHPNTLRFRMKKLGIVRARPAAPPPHRAQ